MIDSTDLPNNQTAGQGCWCPTVQMAESKDSSSGVTIVAVCMTIVALCAVAYFALRWYFENRRLQCSAQMCKCGPEALADALECGDLCRYSEKRAVNVAVQTNLEQHPASSSCWKTSDVRMSEARKSVCAFSSPLPNNDEAAPVGNWRPPVSGSSTRRKSLQMSQGRRLYQHYHHNQHQRRSRTIPPIKIHSPSSSDSYSILTNISKTAALSKDLTAVTFSDEEEERILSQRLNRNMGESCTSPFNPRYNTPVSETNEECVSNIECEHSPTKEEELRNDREVGGGSSRSMGDGDDAGPSGRLQGTPTPNISTIQNNNQDDLKRYQTAGNLSTATVLSFMPIDTIRFVPTVIKARVPSYETLAGGRLITRWTQTDNASQAASLDWDPYEWERLRSADTIDDFNFINEDLGEGSSATLLMASHNSETTLHALSQRSASSPYVICFECNGEAGDNEDRRNSTCIGRGTSVVSSPDPRSSTLHHHQPYLALPRVPNFLTPSPSHTSQNSTSRISRPCKRSSNRE